MWFLILGLLGLLYLGLNTVIPSQGTLGTYVLQPLLWIGLALLTLIIARNEGLNILRFKRVPRWYIGNSPLQAGLLLGGFQVSLLLITGLFTGFGKSPSAFTPTSITLNILYVSTFLLGTEITRAYLIRRGTRTRRHTTLILTGTTLLYVGFQLTINQITSYSTAAPAPLLEFLGKTVVTAISMNLLASYLAYMGGATASISYVGVLMAFNWFSPILPNPHWTILALIGTIAPAIGYTLIQTSIKEPHIKQKHKHHKSTTAGGAGWTAVTIFSIVMVFFSAGFLGVKPTVIYSGSMTPTLHVGDIVLIQKTDPTTLKTGDIIQFISPDNVTLVHRIHTIATQDNQTLYTTKGDANQDPDSTPITQQRILGKDIFTIPFIGWIQIAIRDALRNAGIKL